MREPLERYLSAFGEYRGSVERLLRETVDLAELGDAAVEVLTDPALLDAVRYLAGPGIPVDELKVLADASLARTALRKDRTMARRVIETVLSRLDRTRFPWLAQGRGPTEGERDAAVLATAVLMASQRARAGHASEARAAYDDAVSARLMDAGLAEVPPPRIIPTLAQAPRTGEFCRKTVFGTCRADLVIGLWDERKMPLECKVSNSLAKSISRLKDDAAVKAAAWIRQFGAVSVVPAAVLSGAFKRRHLEGAQELGLTIFWAHRLDALVDWIAATRGPQPEPA